MPARKFMKIYRVIWDWDEDEDGNAWHIALRGITKEEVEEVLYAASEIRISRSSGRPATRGYTTTGKCLFVVFEFVERVPVEVYSVTAYEID
jgi:hypothetical protein